MIMESEQKKEDQEEFRYWTSLEINAEDKANQRGLGSKTLNLARNNVYFAEEFKMCWEKYFNGLIW